MKKKIFFGLICVGFVSAFLFARTSRTNLDNDPNYKPMLGKVFKTKKDLVVVDFNGGKKTVVLGIPGISGIPELKDIPEKLPFDYYGHDIYGVFPAGAAFRIAHIEYVKSFEFSFTDFYVDVIGEGKFKGQRFEIGQLTNQSTTVPTMDEEYLEEIIPAK